MRMSVQVPRSMMGAIPDAHGIVTDHDGLAMYGDFRKVAEPRELLGQLANLFVVIARHRKDLPAANLLAVLQSPHLAPDVEIPKEIEDVIGLNGGVETVSRHNPKRTGSGAYYKKVPWHEIELVAVCGGLMGWYPTA